MTKKIILTLLVIGSLIIAEESKGSWFTSRSTTFGLFDGKYGVDFFSISKTIYEEGNNEIFVGFGTSLFISTQAGIGWKHYYETDSKLQPFSCVSMFSRSANKMAVPNGDSVREDDCIGLSTGASYMIFDRKEGKRDIYINFGAIAIYDFRNKLMGYPFINIEFK